MALFGERPSVSPRLPSPWQAALAISSPAISVISRNDIESDVSPGSRTSRSHSRHPSEHLNALRTPSQLSLSTVSGDLEEQIDDAKLAESTTSSLSSSSAFQRLCSSGVSENLILSPTPGYTSSTSASTSVSSSALIDPVGQVRQGVSGGLAGHGYEGVKLIAERDKVGHIEYKLRLLPPSTERFERLTTQLKWRLQEGGGQAVYEIGVLDDGTLIGITDEDMDRSLQTLELMAAELGATVMVLRTITLASPPPFPKALFGYEGGGSQDGGNEDDSDSNCNLFAHESHGGSQRKTKKKKSPKPPKTKKKPSVFSRSEIHGVEDSDEPAVTAIQPESYWPSVKTQGYISSNSADYREPTRKKCESKMARRGQSSGFPKTELSAKQRKAWGLGRKGASTWDEYGDNGSEDDGQTWPALGNSDSARICGEFSDFAATAVPVPTSPERVDSELNATPAAESWRARNMERALQHDTSRWRRKPVLTQAEREEVKESRKARRKLKKGTRVMEGHTPEDREGFNALFKSEDSGEEDRHARPVSGDVDASPLHRADPARESEVEDEGFEMFAFDNFPSSESVGQPLTQAALAAFDAGALHQLSAQRPDPNGFHQSTKIYGHGAQMHIRALQSNKSPKKQVKQRRVRVKRAEERRLDLLRGDGITPEGMPLTFEFDSHVGATSLMEAVLNDGLSDNGDDSIAIKSVVRRLIGDEDGECGELMEGGGESVEVAPLFSTSPSYTIKPISPSAQRLFSLPLPSVQSTQGVPPYANLSKHSQFVFDPSPPSPSDTITMPLDNLSLSFSHDEVCTALSPLGSPALSDSGKDERYSFHDKFTSHDPHARQNLDEESLQKSAADNPPKLDLANARLCVEALIVKKMDMDERYLDYSGFIL